MPYLVDLVEMERVALPDAVSLPIRQSDRFDI